MVKLFKSLDIFGHPIGVHYKGSETFQTHLGALCTILAYVLMTFNFYTMTAAFLDHSRQEEKVQRSLKDPYNTPEYIFHDHLFSISVLSNK